MNRFLLMPLCLLLVLGITSCSSTKEATSSSSGSPVLLHFDQEDVTKREFERVYQKNNGGYAAAETHTAEQYREYLDLYVNFKRKVFEAEAKGLDSTRSFKQEFESYRKQLAQPYLSAKEVEDQLIKEAYDRSKFVIKASHLLIKVDENALPSDTLAAYTKIMGLRDSVMKGGKDFAVLAEKYSEDPSAKTNQGNLGYFSVFDMVYPFENGAFDTPVGQVSEPLRTQFGYHILKVEDRIETPGIKYAAHIIVRIGDRYSARDTAQAIARINEIYEKLNAGEDFAALAAQYSDDPTSAERGGDLGDSRLLPEMEEVKLKLKEGAYSRPFSTRFGWHILKVTKTKAKQSYEEAIPELKRKIERDSRAQLSREALLKRIKTENNYALNDVNFTTFKGLLNSNFPRGNWTPSNPADEVYQLPLFTLGDKLTRTLEDFSNYYQKTKPRYPRLSSIQAADVVLKNFVNSELVAFEESQLPEKYPEYSYLLQEYRDGILLFTLMEDMVWKKAVEDTTGLKRFYEANQDQFQQNLTLETKEYRTSSEEIIDNVDRLLKLGATDQEIDSLVNQKSSLSLSMRTISIEQGKNDEDPALFNQQAGYVSSILRSEEEYRILKIVEKLPAGTKPFDRARSEAITRYQDYLESEWLKDLAYKYPVEIKEDVFETLFK